MRKQILKGGKKEMQVIQKPVDEPLIIDGLGNCDGQVINICIFKCSNSNGTGGRD